MWPIVARCKAQRCWRKSSTSDWLSREGFGASEDEVELSAECREGVLWGQVVPEYVERQPFDQGQERGGGEAGGDVRGGVCSFLRLGNLVGKCRAHAAGFGAQVFGNVGLDRGVGLEREADVRFKLALLIEGEQLHQ